MTLYADLWQRADPQCCLCGLEQGKQRAIVFTDSKERLEKQTRAFVKKVSSKDFAKRIERMVKRGYVVNN